MERVQELFQVEVDAGSGTQAQVLPDLPDSGGIAPLLGELAQEVTQRLLFGGQSVHALTLLGERRLLCP